MPICRQCQSERPAESFEVCRIVAGKVYRRRKCQQCKRTVTNARRAKLRQWLDTYKRTRVCERCGFADFRALQFHHKESGGKEFNLADMVHSGFREAKIQCEISKCIVLCANCHQIEHYQNRG